MPDENDFQHFDTNKDGKLLFDEWLTQVNKDWTTGFGMVLQPMYVPIGIEISIYN